MENGISTVYSIYIPSHLNKVQNLYRLFVRHMEFNKYYFLLRKNLGFAVWKTQDYLTSGSTGTVLYT